MRIFFTLISFVIILCFLLNFLIIINFLDPSLELKINGKYKVPLAITIINAIIVVFIVKKIFHDPIINLEYNIKTFLVGGLKNKKIELEKTRNPHINYILLFFNKTLNTLKNIKSEFIHGKEIKREVELAKEIQGKILTRELISIPSLDIVARSKPAGEIGGDSYDIIRQGDNYYIYVGDATGHGVGSGFIMMMVNSLISGFSKSFKDGAHILSNTNEILKPRVKANLLMSMLLLRRDEKEKKLFMTGAGHEYLMIYKHEKNKCYKVKSGGLALGMIKDISKLIKEKEIEFEKNDIIVLYTDGITESINCPKKDGNEEMFGENRLLEAIEKAPKENNKKHRTAKTVFNNITIELSKFMGYKYTQLDDITLSVIHYLGDDSNTVGKNYEPIEDDFITEWNWE